MSQQMFQATIPQMAGPGKPLAPEIHPAFMSSTAISTDGAHAQSTVARTTLPEHASQP
jgi:hypothetical protein